MDTTDPAARFVRDVASFGDRHELVAREAIWSSTRVKLLEAGTRVDSRLYERLAAHRLRVPIETSLTTPGAVDGAALAAAAAALVAAHPLYARIGAEPGGVEALCDELRWAPLPAPLGLVLAVMRESRPELFDHSLKVAVLAVHLARRRALPRRARAELASAGIAHDIGTLHIDPELLAPGRRLEAAERRHVYVHPVTAQMMLEEYGGVPPAARVAVLEHHERLDGTGYPRGLAGSAISPLGNVLMVCEIVAVLFDRHDAERGAFELPVLLKLARRKFDRQLVDAMIGFLGGGGVPPGHGHETERSAATLETVAAALAEWTALRDELGDRQPPALAAIVGTLEARIVELSRSMLEAGVSLTEPAADPSWRHDATSAGEMATVAREAAWQLGEVIHEVRRRHGEVLAEEAPAARRLSTWLDETESDLTATFSRP